MQYGLYSGRHQVSFSLGLSSVLGLQRLKEMHWLFCSFTGESRGFPRANPVPFETGPVVHVVGFWFSSAVLFCVELRLCAE